MGQMVCTMDDEPASRNVALRPRQDTHHDGVRQMSASSPAHALQSATFRAAAYGGDPAVRGGSLRCALRTRPVSLRAVHSYALTGSGGSDLEVCGAVPEGRHSRKLARHHDTTSFVYRSLEYCQRITRPKCCKEVERAFKVSMRPLEGSTGRTMAGTRCNAEIGPLLQAADMTPTACSNGTQLCFCTGQRSSGSGHVLSLRSGQGDSSDCSH